VHIRPIVSVYFYSFVQDHLARESDDLSLWDPETG
jgi:hypothetical protein